MVGIVAYSSFEIVAYSNFEEWRLEMDKIYISQDEENKLFQWRDEHKNLVRNYKASTKKVKYILFYEMNNTIIITVIDGG